MPFDRDLPLPWLHEAIGVHSSFESSFHHTGTDLCSVLLSISRSTISSKPQVFIKMKILSILTSAKESRRLH